MDAYDPKNDFYVVLGVADDATTEDIKRTYRTKAKLVHPDGHRQPELATRETQAINAAYEVLGDAARRLAYDERRATFRLRGQEAEIKRRVAEALAQAQPPARAGGAVRARADGVRAKAAGVKAKAATVKATALAKSPSPGRAPGVFERLAQPKVDAFMRQNQPIDAAVWNVGATLLDVWLGTTARTKRPARPRRPRRR